MIEFKVFLLYFSNTVNNNNFTVFNLRIYLIKVPIMNKTRFDQAKQLYNKNLENLNMTNLLLRINKILLLKV